MRKKPATDAAIALIAGGQHGIVTTAQLSGTGITSPTITRRVHLGRLHRIHRGVYAVGHTALSNEGRWMAAVLACGDGAVLSHRSAAELWAMLAPTPGVVHVTLPDNVGRAQRAGLRIHRSPSLRRSEVTSQLGIPTTTPARTIADLRRSVAPWLLREAIREATFRGLDIADEQDETRSHLEARFRRVCRRHGLPPPEVNVAVGPFTADFLWRDQRLIVETDGWRAHRGRQAFEDDRARDAHMRRLGYEVLRFTYRQVTEEPDLVLATVRAALFGA